MRGIPQKRSPPQLYVGLHNQATMPVRPDWKFLLTLLFTVASIVIPVWLWQADLSSKGLTLTLVSTVELQPQSVGALEGLQVSVDGTSVITPFVSVLELSNSGTRPILAADFESPLKIIASKTSEVVKAQVESTMPSSLTPKIEVLGGTLLVYPLLMNPGDALKLTVITEKSRPNFLVRARIAGVQEVNLRDAQSSRKERSRWVVQAVACLLLIVYIVNLTDTAYAAVRKKAFLAYNAVTGLIAGIGAAFLLVVAETSERLENPEMWPVMLSASVVSAVVLIARRRQRSAV